MGAASVKPAKSTAAIQRLAGLLYLVGKGGGVKSILALYINWGLQIVGLVPDQMLIMDRESLHKTSNVTRQVIILGG
jgi:hypothetical protein